MTNDRNDHKALKAGLGYTVGNILIKGLSFLSVFLFSRLLTVAEFGIFNTYSAYTSIVFVVIGFALHSSIKNANNDYRDRISEYCSSVTVPMILNTLFVLLLAAVFAKPLSRILYLDKPILVVFVVADSFFLAMITFYNSVLAINYRYKEYLTISLAYALLGMGLSLLLVLHSVPGERYMGRVLGVLVSAALITAYIFVRLYRDAKPAVNPEFWKYGLKISLPIVPHGLSQIVLAQFDRLMIKAKIGSEEAGLYSFAYTIATIYTVVAGSLDTAWTQWFYDQMRENNILRIRRAANIYAGLMSLAAVLLMLISPELILIMGGKKYLQSTNVAFPVILAMYYSFMYYFPAAIEYYYKKTQYIAVGTMSAAVLNIILNLIFIPIYGYVAAAYTTVVCYFFYYVLHIYISGRIQRSPVYDLKTHYLFIAIVTAMMFLLVLTWETGWLRLVMLAAVILGTIGFGLARKEKLIQMIKELK